MAIGKKVTPSFTSVLQPLRKQQNTFNWAVELSQQRASRETMFSECEGALGWGGWQPYWPRDFSQAQHGSCNPVFTEHRPRQALLEQMRAFAPHTNCTGSRMTPWEGRELRQSAVALSAEEAGWRTQLPPRRLLCSQDTPARWELGPRLLRTSTRSFTPKASTLCFPDGQTQSLEAEN